MMARLRGVVSGKNRRYQQGGYDLDLAYVTDRVIAMSYPFEGTHEYWRNPLSKVKKFLNSKHKDHYMLFNLCSERQYKSSKFDAGVACFPFEDHQAPPLPLMAEFCERVANWLSKHPENVAVVHCKAGKGRTGTMICAYLVHSGTCQTALEALDLYASRRTKDGNGVTNPSQRRYVQYYANVLQQPDLGAKKMHLQRVVVSGLPADELKDLVLGVWSRPLGAGWKTELLCLASVQSHGSPIQGQPLASQQISDPGLQANGEAEQALRQSMQPLALNNNTAVLDCAKLAPAHCWLVQGDVKVEVFLHDTKKKDSLVWTWFSTMFVPDQQTLTVNDLDHSKSLSAGSLTPNMYKVWTRWLKMARSVQDDIQLSIQLAACDPG